MDAAGIDIVTLPVSQTVTSLTVRSTSSTLIVAEPVVFVAQFPPLAIKVAIEYVVVTLGDTSIVATFPTKFVGCVNVAVMVVGVPVFAVKVIS